MPGAVFNSWDEVTGPTVLRAESVAAPVLPALLGAREARVHSVYRRAVNLLVGGELVAVLSKPPGRVPNGVHLEDEVDFADAAHGLAAGRDVAIEDGVVRLAAELRVDVRWAPPWSFELQPVLPLGVELLTANSARLRARVRPDLVLVAPGRALGRALRSAETDEIETAVAGLIGLGPGLTPAGDDLLLGALAVLQAGDHPAGAVVAGAVMRGAERTGEVSAALLRLAAGGQHAELIARLAVALLAGDRVDVDVALGRLLAVESGSAAGAALGALVGVESVAKWRQAGMLPEQLPV